MCGVVLKVLLFRLVWVSTFEVKFLYKKQEYLNTKDTKYTKV